LLAGRLPDADGCFAVCLEAVPASFARAILGAGSCIRDGTLQAANNLHAHAIAGDRVMRGKIER
jgi:hypothetical protein